MPEQFTWWHGFLLFCWMVGAGGIPTILVAWLGRRKAAREARSEPPVPAPQPVEVASPWLVQNLLEIKLTVESIKDGLAALTAAINAMAVQINALAHRRQGPRRSK